MTFQRRTDCLMIRRVLRVARIISALAEVTRTSSDRCSSSRSRALRSTLENGSALYQESSGSSLPLFLPRFVHTYNALSRLSELRSDRATGPHLRQRMRSIIVIDIVTAASGRDAAFGSGRIADEVIRSRNCFVGIASLPI